MEEERIRILIVDDEYAFCKALKLYLTKLGYEAIIATNGEHALDLIKEERPRVMTLDIRMPGMDGYEVLNHARHLYPELCIIVITAVDVPRMEELLERSGAEPRWCSASRSISTRCGKPSSARWAAARKQGPSRRSARFSRLSSRSRPFMMTASGQDVAIRHP